MSERETDIDRMLEAGTVIRTWTNGGVEEMRLRTRREMAEDIYDEVVAPLLAEAERRGAEKGWDEGYQAGAEDEVSAYWQSGDVSETANPYRAGADQ